MNLKNYSIYIVGLCLMTLSVSSQETTRFTGNVSIPYDECIASYADLAASSGDAFLLEMGKTDIGKPLHLFIINKDGDVRPSSFPDDKAVILINNGIHPGEPCGIDASLKLAGDLLSGKPEFDDILETTVICIIPIYNVGGSLNRGCCSRANQNGPEKYGFRGNAKNLDLNRDFIKADSENAKSFSKIFQLIQPHLFLDTHTSNGSDYQYVMTMIHTQPDKAHQRIGDFILQKVNPIIYESMENKGWGMVPYVHTMGRTPEQGIMDFLETPRYSTGYTALFNTIGFTSETHMFKPFADRVESTYQFELTLLQFAQENIKDLLKVRKRANEEISVQKQFALQWELDTTSWKEIQFSGYEPEFSISEVTGQERLSYNREEPKTTSIKHYDKYLPKVVVEKPDYYIIPQGWSDVIERLRINGVKMLPIVEDRVIEVEAYHITDYDSKTKPYEGHYLHDNVEVEKVVEPIQFYRGDIVIPTNQPSNKFIVEMLEPQGVDSYFAWNFFDSILQQKEWFSDYIFEDEAEQMLSANPDLRAEFEAKKKAEPQFSQNHWWMLYWLYQQSEHFENSFNRFPVYRYNGEF